MNRSMLTRRGLALSQLLVLISLLILGPSYASAQVAINAPHDLGNIPLGVSATIKLPVTAGRATYTLTVETGVLPYGMVLLSGDSRPPGYSENESALFGAPSMAGVFDFALKLTSAAGTDTQPFRVTVVPLSVANAGTLPAAIAGEPYSYSFAFAPPGTTGTILVDPESPPPAWLSLQPSGRLTGTPPQAGGYPLRFVARTSAGEEIRFNAFLPVHGIATPGVLPNAPINQPYSLTLRATWTGARWKAYSMPPGLSLDPVSGVISGTPSQSGTFRFEVGASNASGSWSYRMLALTVPGAPLTISNWQRDVSVGESLADPIQANGGTPPYRWSVTPGTMPSGLILESPEAALPVQTLDAMVKGAAMYTGAYYFTVQVIDSASNTASRTVRVSVSPVMAVAPGMAPEATRNVPYSYRLAQAGATPPYSFRLVSGSLPVGIALNASTGELSGTPVDTGFYWPCIEIADSSVPVNKMVRCTYGLAVRPASGSPHLYVGQDSDLGTYTVNLPLALGLSAAGDYVSPVRFELPPGNQLPPGMTLVPGPQSPAAAALLSGIPSETGSFTFQLLVTDANNVIGARTFTLRISPIGFEWNGPLAGVSSNSYNLTLTASGGTGPYEFSLIRGELPPGLYLASNGWLYGNPSTVGSYSALVRAVDSNHVAGEIWLNIPIAAVCSYSVSPAGTTTFGFQGGDGLANFSTSNGCPVNPTTSAAWLTITSVSSNTLTFSYRVAPTSGGERTATISLGTGQFTVTQKLLPVEFQTSEDLGRFEFGRIATATLRAVNGKAPYTYVLETPLPRSFSLLTGKNLPGGSAETDAVLYGTPLAAGDYSLTVRVTGSDGSTATRTFTFSVSPIYLKTTELPVGYEGMPYDYTLSLAGGTGTLTVEADTSSLPPGLGVNAAGRISGTPTAAGYYNFSFTARDTAGHESSFGVSIRIDAIRIDTAGALPIATIGAAYSQTLHASGGTGSYTWSAGCCLPPGLSLDPQTGLLSGTPSGGGLWMFNVTVTAGSQTGSRQFALSVRPAVSEALQIDTNDIPDASAGEFIYRWFYASGGVPPYTWSITSGTLPPGVSLVGTTEPQGTASLNARLTGAARQTGTYVFTLQVRDSAGNTATRTFSLLVSPIIAVQTCCYPEATRGVPYSYFLSQAAGKEPYSFQIVDGYLPAGLQLNAATGEISGTATDTGHHSFRVRISDSSAPAISITRNYYTFVRSGSGPNTVQFNQNRDLGTVRAGDSRTWRMGVQGGVAPYTFRAANQAAVPPGLTLAPDTSTNDAVFLSGTPTTIGTYQFELLVTDADGTVGARTFTLMVSPLGLSWDAPTDGVASVAYNLKLNASGGSGPYVFSIVSGQLPPGLSLSQGILSGTPTTPGYYRALVRATDSNNVTGEFWVALNIASACTYNLYAESATVFGLDGGEGTARFSTANGCPVTISTSDSGWLTIPTAPSGFQGTFKYRVGPSSGGVRTGTISLGTAQLSVTQQALPLEFRSGENLGIFSRGLYMNRTLRVVGGRTPYTFALDNSTLPDSLHLLTGKDAAAYQDLGTEAVLFGTPLTTGDFSFALRVTDAQGATATRTFTFRVSPIYVQDASMPDGYVGQPYDHTLKLAGGTGSITVELTGNMPAGLGINSTGRVSGTPTETGWRWFSITARDAAGNELPASFGLYLRPLRIDTGGVLTNGVLNQPFSQTLAATGGTPPYLWGITGGESLPPGLILNPNTGEISGTPSQSGRWGFNLTVTDRNYLSFEKYMTLAVKPASPDRLEISNQNLPDVSVGENRELWLWAWGGVEPYHWSIVSGELPLGYTLVDPGAQTPIERVDASLRGAAHVPGTYTFTVQVRDSAGNTASRQYKLLVSPILGVQPCCFLEATRDVPYSYLLSQAGGKAPYSFQLVDGDLPAGLELNPNTGEVSGTPADTGHYWPSVRITDSSTPPLTMVRDSYYLRVRSGSGQNTVYFDQRDLGTALLGQTVNWRLQAQGGVMPYTFRVVDPLSLPPGLTVSPEQPQSLAAILSGTLAQEGTYRFQLLATDLDGTVGARTFTLRVTPITIRWTSNVWWTSSMSGSVGQPFLNVVQVSGGTAPYTWTLLPDSNLPPGLTFENGRLSGTPTAPGTNYPIRVRVTDSAGNSNELWSALTIAGFTISTPSVLPNATAGVPYSQQLAVSGTPSGRVTFQSWDFPDIVSSDGLISFTPVDYSSGCNSFYITATDASGAFVAKRFTICVPANGAPAALSLSGVGEPLYFSAGVPVAQSLNIAGGTPPYRVELTSGTLPAGLELGPLPEPAGDPGATYISGTPTAPGSSDIEIRITDAAGKMLTRQMRIVVSRLQLMPEGLPPAQFNVTYQSRFSASGGSGPYTFALVSGAWPQGIAMNAAGLVSGTPIQSGGGQVRIRVSDQVSNVFERNVYFHVNTVDGGGEGMGFITAPRLPDATAGAVYQARIDAWGVSSPVWRVKPGSTLPPGITLLTGAALPAAYGSNSAMLYGVAPPAGTYSFTLQFSKSETPSLTAERTFVLVVSPLGQLNVSLPQAYMGQTYTAQLEPPVGGTGTAVWKVSFGSALPGGWTLSESGVLSGSVSQDYISFTAEVTLGGATLTRTYGFPPARLLVTSGPELPRAIAGAAYSQALAVAGGTAPFTWTRSGSLPSGMTLSQDGVLSGTPSSTGWYGFDVTVRDADGQTNTAFRILRVFESASQLPAIDPAGPWVMSAGVAASLSLSASGGTTPYTWELASGSLPAGLVLRSGSSVNTWYSQWSAALIGTPTIPGTSDFTLRVRDASGATATRQFTITVAALSVLSRGSTPAVLGSPYRVEYAVAGGTPPYNFELEPGGLLPAGLQLVNGVLSGQPAETGYLNWRIRVTDAANPANAYVFTDSINIQPASGGTLGISSSKRLTAAVVHVPYSYALSPAGATWTVAAGSELPSGLTLNGNVLAGSLPTAGSYRFTLQATDAQGNLGLREFVLDVSALGIEALAFQGSAGIPYRGRFYPTSGTPPFTWSLDAGSTLPKGLTLSSSGTLEGVPAETGEFGYTVRLTDSTGLFTSRTYSLSVSPIRVITQRLLPVGVANQPYSAVRLEAQGGTPPYTWKVSGGIPSGLSLSPDGLLSGTPSGYGTLTFDVQVSDSSGNSAIEALGLPVLESPPTALRLASRSNTDLSAGLLVTETLSALGGAPPYSYALAGGTLPPGLELVQAAALLADLNPGPLWLVGVPRVPGLYAFDLRVTDAANSAVTKHYEIRVSPMRIVKTPGSLWLNQEYGGQQFLVAGGKPPYTWQIAGGALPAGVTFTLDGRLTGTPLESGRFYTLFTVTDADGQTFTRFAPVWVLTSSAQELNPGLPLEVTAQVNTPFTFALNPSGGTAPYRASLLSRPGYEPPAGIEIKTESGNLGIGGTPALAGRFPLLVEVRDSAEPPNVAVKAITMVVSPLALTVGTLPTAVYGAPYSAALAVSGGTAPYQWSLAPGAGLPAGMTLTPGGILAGTPGAAGQFSISVVIRDSATLQNTLAGTLSLGVVPIPVAGCAYQLTPVDPVPAAGGDVSFRVTPNAPLCEWRLERDPASTFVTITSGSSGTGDGTVSVQVIANTETASRAATLRLTGTSLGSAGKQISIHQYGAEEKCHYVVRPATLELASTASATILDVRPSASACEVSASSNASWLSVVKTTENRYVEVAVEVNTGDTRAALLTIGDQTVAVTQQKPCTATLNALAGTIEPAGGVRNLSVTTDPAGCAYAAQSNDSWLTVVSTLADGITYSVAQNSSTKERQGSIRVGQQTFQLTQPGVACSFSLSAGARVFGNSGGSGSIDIATQDEGVCNWTAGAVSNSENWLSLTSASEGTGSGRVEFTVVPNLSQEAREGTVTIAGQQLRILQSGLTCTYVLRGAEATMPFVEGSDSVEVLTPAGCPLTVSSSAAWLTALVDKGTVRFTARKNESAADRAGVLTIQGRVFIVKQAGAPCVFTTDKSSAATTAPGGTVAIGYTALTNGCAAPEVTIFDSWIRLSGAPGDGVVNLEIAGNAAPMERGGSVSVGGRMIKVTQAAAVCSYGISPFAASFLRDGGESRFSLAAGPVACAAPDPAPPPSWIRFMQSPPLEPTGPGLWAIPFHVDPFPAAARSTRRAYINVGGRSFTVRQFSR